MIKTSKAGKTTKLKKLPTVSDTHRGLVPLEYRGICDRIREMRKSASMTTEDFAKELNMSRQGVTHMETYRYLPRINTLILLSKKFKRSYNWILEGK